MVGATHDKRLTDQRLVATRGGWSLLELIVVVGLIGLVLQLLTPALSAAREASRQLQCGHHLREVGIAMIEHHDVQGHLPSGGWHFMWIGEPERGTGPTQPGGWAFNLLSYLDASELRSAGHGLVGAERDAAFVKRCATALPVFHCPSRRTAVAYPQTWHRQPMTRDGATQLPIEWVAKSDYAANTGDAPATEFDWHWLGPRSLAEGDAVDFDWPATSIFTGVIYGRSQLRFQMVRDGLSKTYLVGEKYLAADQYETGEDWGDNESLYNGFNNDSCRTTAIEPRRDEIALDWRNGFGSAHPTAWRMLMCDGSLRQQTYDIDLAVHREYGNRNDRRRAASVTTVAKGARYVSP